MSEPIPIIWNPAAGNAEVNQAAREALTADPDFQVIITESPEDAIRQTRAAMERGCRRIVAAGGDGTVNDVMNVLLESSDPPELGVMALGTGNDLARSLGMPLTPDESREVLRSAPAVRIDVIEAATADGVRFAANMITGGNTGKFMLNLQDEQKQAWGPLCYLRGAVDVLQDLTAFSIELAFDDGPAEEYLALNLFVANGRSSGGGLTVSPEALLNNGAFDVLVVLEGPPIELADLAAHYVLSDIREHELIHWRRARRMRVRLQSNFPASIDGNLLDEFPRELTIRAGALPAVVGPGEPAVALESTAASGENAPAGNEPRLS